MYFTILPKWTFGIEKKYFGDGMVGGMDNE